MLNGLKAYGSESVNIYHFTHLENAVSILSDMAIKSRNSATFKNSAGDNIISQTEDDRKEYVRFYYRTKTPTQYYCENLGMGEYSVGSIGSDPLCPVPIFFTIPLEQLLEKVDWNVSLGTLASNKVKVGNDFETISQFGFSTVFNERTKDNSNEFLMSAAQEFLVRNSLDLSTIDFTIGVQNQAAKYSLLALLGDAEYWEPKIMIAANLYRNENANVLINLDNDTLDISVTKDHPGELLLQYSLSKSAKTIDTEMSSLQPEEEWITLSTNNNLKMTNFSSDNSYRIFYQYKGCLWLIHTNENTTQFNFDIIKEKLKSWVSDEDSEIEHLFLILRQHPVLRYLYSQPIGGPDRLTLEEHTRNVIENYLEYFFGKQTLFYTDNEFILFLAFHDIGKPIAIQKGNKEQQHVETIKILTDLKEMLPLDENSFYKFTGLVNGDPLGQYLNINISEDFETTIDSISKIKDSLRLNIDDFCLT
ncbi:DUF4433 domain-containing protein [Sphingobacterium sp. KU25419]|nr:DUF4433 domain-containing protein [Sphingobacterium sp. KU25419]